MHTFSLAVIWFVAMGAVGCANVVQTGRSQQFDDAVITAKVIQALGDQPSLNAREINVETSNGRVQLSGFVDDRDDVKRAAEVALSVAGVRTVERSAGQVGTFSG